jgi:hypothetical protein
MGSWNSAITPKIFQKNSRLLRNSAMVVMHGTRAKIVVSRPDLWIKTNYSINKHGLGNKTTAISLLNLSEACARRGEAGPFQ